MTELVAECLGCHIRDRKKNMWKIMKHCGDPVGFIHQTCFDLAIEVDLK